MLTQERLKEILDYNPETGVFVWRVSKGPCEAGGKAGTVNNNGYVHIKIERKLHQAHRLAWLYTYGCWPDKDIDHINRMKTDNRIENLRDTDKNDWNRDKHSNNTSGYPGVSWYKRSKKWRAKITVSGKQMHLGLFDTPEAANAAYMAAKEKLHIID
jgi:hypothetical protein